MESRLKLRVRVIVNWIRRKRISDGNVGDECHGGDMAWISRAAEKNKEAFPDNSYWSFKDHQAARTARIVNVGDEVWRHGRRPWSIKATDWSNMEVWRRGTEALATEKQEAFLDNGY